MWNQGASREFEVKGQRRKRTNESTRATIGRLNLQREVNEVIGGSSGDQKTRACIEVVWF